jgi:hypothetical protein
MNDNPQGRDSKREAPKAREAAKSLPESLGLAESFLTMGREAGFDMTSHEDVAAWSIEFKRRIKAQPLPEEAPPTRQSPFQAFARDARGSR